MERKRQGKKSEAAIVPDWNDDRKASFALHTNSVNVFLVWGKKKGGKKKGNRNKIHIKYMRKITKRG